MTTAIENLPIAAIPRKADASSDASSRPVLARDADASYWMARYVERAEHIARLLLVNSEVLIDVGDLEESLIDRHWQSVLQIMNVETPADGEMPISQRIAEHMTFNPSNPNSLFCCLTRGRENARSIRELISSDMWEQLNMLYWTMRADGRTLFTESPDQLYRQIMTGSMLFQGLTDHTLDHSQRWFFIQLGKYFERIATTCRTLKIKYELLHATESEMDAPLTNVHWSAVLRCCGSLEAYRQAHLSDLDPLHVAQFLVLQEDFPRSVRYCVHQAHQSIAAIRAAVRPRAVDPTERILGRLDAQLEYAEAKDLVSNGLPDFLGQILDAISEAALAVQRSFFLH